MASFLASSCKNSKADGDDAKNDVIVHETSDDWCLDWEWSRFLLGIKGEHILHKQEKLQEIWAHLRRHEPELLDVFEEFLDESVKEMGEIETDRNNAVKSKERSEKNVQNIYTDLESILEEERNRIRDEFEDKYKGELRHQVSKKDRELDEMEQRRRQLQRQLSIANRMEAQRSESINNMSGKIDELTSKEEELKQENEILQQKNKSLEVKLSISNTNFQRLKKITLNDSSGGKTPEQKQQEDTTNYMRRNWLNRRAFSLTTNRLLPERILETDEESKEEEEKEEQEEQENIDVQENNIEQQQLNLYTPSSTTCTHSNLLNSSLKDEIDVEKATHLTWDNCAGCKPKHVYKIIMIGDSGVGKTCIARRFCCGTFDDNRRPTIGISYTVKSLPTSKGLTSLQIWDTAGQERFSCIPKQYYRKADGVFIVFDVMKPESLKNVYKWLTNIEDLTESDSKGSDYLRLTIMLVGNKIDCNIMDRKITTQQGYEIARSYGIRYAETSARSGENLEETFEEMTNLLHEQEENSINFQSTNIVNIGSNRLISTKKCCHHS